ncbi:6605_t:CDS:2, partial [Dentiscutata heterogama]
MVSIVDSVNHNNIQQNDQSAYISQKDFIFRDSNNTSWADALPPKQGLYDPDYEKDSCGVGFIVHIRGAPSHKILSDARDVLCNMTHRGAVGSDARDGDGAGVMTGIPHEFFHQETTRLGINLPPQGQYAVGNVFFKPEHAVTEECKQIFEQAAKSLNLKVLGWREVPKNDSILGPAAKSREPIILQPFVSLASYDPVASSNNSLPSPNDDNFDEAYFSRQLYILRKQTTHAITVKKWFYICSLSNKNIIYKGQLAPVQVYNYFHDLNNVAYRTHFALVHSRFSTNTFPSWDRAQPMRWCAHNGEINTLRGNKNWMRAREGIMKSDSFGADLDLLYPIIEEGGSDSAAFDNVLELLVINGVVTLPEAVMMMIPEAWQNNFAMEPEKRAFYQWAACLMEPWDGPALFTFSDGRYCGASLDRNGLRPCRFYITTDDLMICASEVGTIGIEPERIVKKGRLQPGKMLLVDTEEGRVVDDKELKLSVASKANFRAWLDNNMITLDNIIERIKSTGNGISVELDDISVSDDPRLHAFGYTIEQLNLLVLPMLSDGKEALGSMGNDAPLACLSDQPRLIYDYFRQLFAQVTNPPIDPIREEIVMSLECYVGPEGNILEIDEQQTCRLSLPTPILSIDELNAIKCIERVQPDWTVATIDITFPKQEGIPGYLLALERICSEVSQAITEGYKVVILSDTAVNAERVAISSLIAVGGVHHHLVRIRQRSKIALVVETAEAREVHHICVLLGYGADAICPYLVMEAIFKLKRENAIKSDLPSEKIIYNYKKAINNGILKVMSKMGISTLQSYKGAQIFEALGIDESVIARCFAGTSSYPTRDTIIPRGLPESGEYHWRDGGEPHINDPVGIANLQDAVRSKNKSAYDAYARNAYDQIKNCTLRGLLDFDFDNSKAIPLDQVEPWTEIVKRFCTGAMSYGSISKESHSTLALAMNSLGGKSNTGEGGEDPERSKPLPNGGSMRSAIKQVASGRFGVTSYYLTDADELQIKMAQGAKPGEGGELPGHKVSDAIGKTRKSTPGVGLISPPPHHDIYSIEDLKQLIYDLKCSNPRSRVSVKLVSEVGVGIVASGVAKAKADHILISGHDGGTGASRWTSIKYAGLPWELGLAETHQTLVLNDLRGRVIVQTDGQLRTGRDVAIACLLGAEEWGFATTPLIAIGCIMMRKCHLNTCPVGIATQDPELRKKFEGKPEHVINFFYYVAEECRQIMAKLGFRKINEMVGRTDKLKVNEPLRNAKTANIDLTPILTPAFTLRPGVATHNVLKQDHKLYIRLDNKLIDESEPALKKKEKVDIVCEILNTDRALGTTLSNHISKTHGEHGLPDGTVH